MGTRAEILYYNARMLISYLLIALVCGIFINYVSDVLPATRRLAKPEWWPPSGGNLRSYFSRLRVLTVIAISLLGAILINQFPPAGFPVFSFTLVLVYFFIVTVIDIEHRVVMHPVSIAGAVIMAAIGIIRGHTILNTVIGGAIGFGFMLAIYYFGDWLGRLMARARNEPWEETALGFGDVNLAGVIGLLTGWPGVVAALFLGMVTAGIFSGVFLVIKMVSGKYKAFAAIPYAPFLCLGAVATVAVGIYLN